MLDEPAPSASGGRTRRPKSHKRPGAAAAIVRGALLVVVVATLAFLPDGEVRYGPVVELDLVRTQMCRPESDKRTVQCDFRTGRASRLTFSMSGAASNDLKAVAILENGTETPLDIQSSFWTSTIDLGPFDHRRLRVLISSQSGAPLDLRRAELRGETDNLLAPLAPLLENKMRRPNVLIYLVDTLRASRMSLYGYHRETTPRIEEFAKRSIVFDQAYSNGSDTRAGIPALFASGTPNQLRGHLRKVHGRPSATIAELLKRRMYRTAAFQANRTIPSSLGFGRGFDRYEVFRSKVDGVDVKTPAETLQKAALEWISADDRFPFFAYIQTMDVHNPYDARPPFRDRYYKGPTKRPTPDTTGLDPAAAKRILATYETLEPDRYDECVAYADYEIGKMLDALDSLGYRSNTVVIITSDHGESLGNGARFPHGISLEEEIVRIPLIIYLPWAPGHRPVHSVVSLVDLAPTIADLVDLRPPADFSGRSLFRSRTRHRPPFALGERNVGGQSVEWFLREGPWKLRILEGKSLLYYINDDPTATDDVSERFPGITDYLAQRVGAMDNTKRGERPGKDGLGLSEAQRQEVEEAMRQLGYE